MHLFVVNIILLLLQFYVLLMMGVDNTRNM